MTETQAKAATASADNTDAPAKQASDGAATAKPDSPDGAASPEIRKAVSESDQAKGAGSTGGGSSGPDDGGAAPAGRAAVGRASVAADSTGSLPKYTRASGMAPPPEAPAAVPAQSTAGASGVTPGTGGGAGVSVGKAKVGTPAGAPASAPPTPGGRKSGIGMPAGSGGPSVAPPVGGISVTGAPVGPAVARATVQAGGATGVRTTNLQADSTRPVAVPGSARVSEAVRSARATVAAAAGRGPRRARLHVKRIDPWSVMKFSFAVSFVLFVVVIVATAVLYLGLDAMGVFGSVNKALVDMVGATGGSASGFKITAKGVIGSAALIGLVNVVLFTALATLGAFIYNVCADLVGGIELTLAERE